MRYPTILAAAAAALALTACGAGDPPKSTTLTANGLTATLPAGWQRARRSLTPHLTEPREILAVATYPLRYRETACAHVAGSALEDLGPDDAFVTLQERPPSTSSRGFPARPAHFGARLGGPSEAAQCVPRARFADHWFTFSDGGRRFHVDVAFGPRATSATRRQAWAILDGLRVRAHRRADG
jgi:hypothetical protein